MTNRHHKNRLPIHETILNFEVDNPNELLAFLTDKMPERKRLTLKQLLAHNQVAVDGVPTRQFDTPLVPGQQVSVNLTREFRVFKHRRVEIVYEDDDIIVANKGYGLLSVGTGKPGEESAYSILKDYLKWKSPHNMLFIVHRLDRDTSGLMVFAKNAEAKETLQYNWNNMVLNRTYVTVVEGVPDPGEGVIRNLLAENSRYEVYITDDPAKGKPAITRYKTLTTGQGKSLVEVELDTGRKNQIRVHMSSIGCPISGDRRYGGHPNTIHRLALHARTLRFVHPVTRRLMDFSTPIPRPFMSLVKSSLKRPDTVIDDSPHPQASSSCE